MDGRRVWKWKDSNFQIRKRRKERRRTKLRRRRRPAALQSNAADMASSMMSSISSSRVKEFVRDAVRTRKVGDVVMRGMKADAATDRGGGGGIERTAAAAAPPSLVEVPHSASVSDTLHAMRTHNIIAVAVAAPPGHWLGAGGSAIIQSDPSTGSPRKHYIGIVSTLDILMHLAEICAPGHHSHQHPLSCLQHVDHFAAPSPSDEEEKLLSSPVSSIIGHSLEGLSLWAFSPYTTVFEALEPMSKGIHRALVALQSPPGDHGVETDIISPSFTMLTQTDLVHFFQKILAAATTRFDADHDNLALRTVESLGVVNHDIFGVPAHMPLVDALKCMSRSSLSAVAILDVGPQQRPDLIPAKGKKIVATFSASDLRGFSVEAFRSWRSESVLNVVKRAQLMRKYGGIGSSMLGSKLSSTVVATTITKSADQLAAHRHDPWMMKSWDTTTLTSEQECGVLQHQVTCWLSSPLKKVLEESLEARIHRVWVVENGGNDILVGVITFSDILRVVRQYCV